MRVGFDVSPLVRPHPRGIVRVVRCLVEELERRAVLEVVRLAPEPAEPLAAWRQRSLPRACVTRGLAGIHSFLSAFPLRGPGRRVQTIHELPWKHGVRENADVRHRLWALAGPLRADRVLTATEFVARDLAGRPGAGKLRVCPWGVGPPFAEEPPPGEVDEPVLARYRLPQAPLALCLDAVRPKKDLAALLRGVAEMRRQSGRPLQIVVTGAETPQLRKDLGLAQRLGLARWMSTPGEIDECDLPALLRLSSVVPVLSRSEGFGLPVLEALASGTPVVVPAESAQAEVAGAHGIAVDPKDAESVAHGLEIALARRESLRFLLPERARELSWPRCAAQVEEIWREIA